MKETLRRLLPKQNITLTDGQLDTLARFGQALLEKNQVMNLTAITAPDKVAELHFYDCLALLNAADFRGKRVIDIGCGAGFPGVPLKIAESSMDLTLLDSLGKRMDWLREVLPELHVEANVVTARAEEYVVSCREGFDIAVSRAVARLNILAELCLPYVKVGGVFLGKVVNILPIGAQVELKPGKKGLVHISRLANHRVEKVEDEVQIGDEILVRVIAIKPDGKIDLTRKELLPDAKK